MRLLALALALVCSAASAQDARYAVYASQTDLDDGGTLAGALPTCIAVAGESYSGRAERAVYFVDRASGSLALFDPDAAAGARTTVVTTAGALDVAAGAPVIGCIDADAAVIYSGGGTGVRVLYLALDTALGSVVLRLGPDGALSRLTDTASSSDAGRGVTGLVYGAVPRSGQFDVPVVYLARARAAGSPENGIYTLDPAAPAQTPAVFVLVPDADPLGITFEQGVRRIALTSSAGGIGEFRNALVRADRQSDGGIAVSVEARPCGDAPTCALGDVVTDYVPDGDIARSYSVFLAREAEARVASLDETYLTASELVAATGIAGFVPAGRNGALAVAEGVFTDGRSAVLVAGSDEGGATPGIYAAAARLPVAGEAGPSFALGFAVFPNPSSGRVAVSLTFAAPAHVRLSVFDALGRELTVLLDGPRAAGAHTAAFDGAALPAGVYVVRAAVTPAGGGAASALVRRFTLVR